MSAPTSQIARPEDHPWLSGSAAPFAGKYTVLRVLGQGGMGVVFEARHIRLGQRVAIKVLGSELREYPELVQRFEREARACGALSSRHAVRVFDIDATSDGTPFIVMELLSGSDLARIVDEDGPQPVARSARWIMEACDAISEAHSLGIIHRDLKPSNLFLAEGEGQGVVKVLDFGIAKRVASQEASITQAVAPLGTPQYMSPEQVRCAKDVDSRTDVWSLGVTLYELVTGQTPFPHESASACIASIAADPVPDPRTLRADLPDAFVAVLMRTLEKNARDRYQSVDELVEALAPFAAADDAAEATISSRRRAFVVPKAPEEQATLAEEAVNEASPSPSPSPSPIAIDIDAPLRVWADSRSDRTVPPAISGASAPPRRRFRSSLAMASAAAIGIAAVFFTPRCVATPGDEVAKNATHHAVAAQVVAPVPAAAVEVPAPAAVEQEPPAAPQPVEPLPVASGSVALARTPAAPVAPVAFVAPVAQPPVVRADATQAQQLRARRAKSDKLPPPAHSDVHGGLSSPGF